MILREVEYQLDFESFWTDSTIVLGYINSSAKRYKTFVANRIQVIRNSTTQNSGNMFLLRVIQLMMDPGD